ncbi:hypothetical protein EB061_01780 [bacterium]|jgi:hypothetical protein|nr:hypothetical protein [bacterium]
MKRKAKVLTLEEIKERMIHQSAENWPHSEPHFGLLPTQEGIKVLPFSHLAETGLLVLFLVDLVDFSFALVLDAVEHLRSSLSNLPWDAVIIAEEKYAFSRSPQFLDRYRITRSFSNIPFLYDQKGDYFGRFQAESSPRIVVLHKGIDVLNLPMGPDFAENLATVEQQLHDALRIDDPGLPLPDISRARFGRPMDRRLIPAKELILQGNWIQTADAVASEDSQATVSFPIQGNQVRLIATTHGNSRESTRMAISFNDEPLQSAHFGSATRQAEKGSAIAEVSKGAGIFEIIHSNVEMKGTVKIRFLNAVENPVILYGVRVA